MDVPFDDAHDRLRQAQDDPSILDRGPGQAGSGRAEEGEEGLIVPGNRRRLQKRRSPRRRLFGPRLKARFLEHLAATCNVAASAAAAGVAVGTVYAHRAKDPAFRADWERALEQGYARLEAALLERAIAGLDRTEIRGDLVVDGPEAVERVDWDRAMDLLRQHRRGLIGLPAATARKPQRVPIEQVTAKLIRKFRALGVTLGAEAASGDGGGGAGVRPTAA